MSDKPGGGRLKAEVGERRPEDRRQDETAAVAVMRKVELRRDLKGLDERPPAGLR